MRTLSFLVVLLISILSIAAIQPWASAQSPESAEQSREAVSCVMSAQSFAGKTAEQWRAEGQDGLNDLIEKMQPQIEQYRSPLFFSADTLRERNPEAADKHAAIEANIRLLDQVAQQRDAYASGLYWYTDLDEAIQEAQRTGKPILSLRMLGKLCDEYSCANSRFFRTALYADESIGKLLREQFILHWKSVRPVPVITIDMGDGRTIKRTITGNSAHYVLDNTGRIIDGIPGLYGPDQFEAMLADAKAIATKLKDANDQQYMQTIKLWHDAKGKSLDQLWNKLVPANQPEINARQAAIQQLQANNQVALPPANRANLRVSGKRLVEEKLAEEVTGINPTALQAGMVTVSKFGGEQPLLRAINNRPTPQQAVGDDELWQRVAEHYAGASRLDASSTNLMRKKTIPASEAFRVTIGKTEVEDPLLKMVRNFQIAVALDTAINEHLMHRQIHQWFIEANAPLDIEKLNSRVYAELFLTPDADPWLGLVPADTYSALDEGGLIK